ncbi:MAG: DUF177 domain-containing protein [Rikenellaceae bacterium]|jgi:uncharacterized metal-binding protein YceD (DUF177 family)|nr:DUF177 domain-containing protein [Rikenellaceae bacterium]
MDVLNRYKIVFNGLSPGEHAYRFRVDDDFWAAFEGSEIGRGTADVDVCLLRAASMLTLDFAIDAEVWVMCDRCLGEFRLPMHYAGTLYVKFSEEEQGEDDGEVMWIAPGEGEVNLAQYIYESISLSLPYQRVHPQDENGKSTCDPDMLKRFKIVSNEEFEEMFSEETLKEEDPEEWQKLAKLKQDMESEAKDEKKTTHK